MDTCSCVENPGRKIRAIAARVSMDAGRGVGMDVVAKSVYAIGGKIGVTTNPGKFTRFKVSLPATEEANTAVA